MEKLAFEKNKKVDNSYREKIRDPITGRTVFGLIGNLVDDYIDNDFREEKITRLGGWKGKRKAFFNKKLRKKLVNPIK